MKTEALYVKYSWLYNSEEFLTIFCIIRCLFWKNWLKVSYLQILLIFLYIHIYMLLCDKLRQIFENYSVTYTGVKPVGSMICYRLHHFVSARTQTISLLLVYGVEGFHPFSQHLTCHVTERNSWLSFLFPQIRINEWPEG